MFIRLFAITFLGCALGADPFESQQEGTSADHIWNWLDAALDFFPLCGYLVHRYLLRDRLPTFIATQFCMGALWVREPFKNYFADFVR